LGRPRCISVALGLFREHLANSVLRYLEDLRKYLKQLKKREPAEGTREERKKEQKRIDLKRKHLKVLVKYIDKDYDEIKKRLDSPRVER
jgi:hypothetical protein